MLSSLLNLGLITVHPENMYIMGDIYLAMWVEDGFSLCLCNLIRLPVMYITSWFNAYSIIIVFSFTTTFAEGISGLGEDFVLNYLSPTLRWELCPFFSSLFIFGYVGESCSHHFG